MKKTLFALAAMALVAVSCNKNGGDDSKVAPLDATFTLSTVLTDALPYGQPTTLEGTAVTAATLDSYTLTAVKKSGETYTAVGEAQVFEATGNEMSVLFFADSKEMTDIELTLKSGKQEAKFYFPATVEGDAWATAWSNEAVAFYPDNKVAHNVNDNVNYPLENTGAGSDTKSFFSMHGVEVNGKIEHVLSLNELLAVDGKNASMCWLNCLEKTDALPNKEDGSMTFIGGQRGYMFSGMRKASLGGGTTGRQCDTQNYDGHQILDANIDYDFEFLAVVGSWAGEKYKEDLYKLVDRIWLAAPGTATNLEQLKTIYALSEIQKQLDNSTLGVEETPTSLGGKTYLRRWADAGHNSTKTVVENFRAGDYIVFRSKKTEGEDIVYYYGLMQILQLPDDSAAFVTKEDTGRRYIDQTLAYDLFMKPAYFAVKTQCQIQK